MIRYLAGLGLVLLCLSGTARAASSECEGNFVNPITDICWECIFPVTIGNVPVAKGRQPDTPNPSMPIQFCPMGILYRVGLAIGYWEPMALTDVTRSPYCMVNLGGFNINIGNVGSGSGGQESRAKPGAFYHVHWYKYPLTYWLNIITSMGCLQGGDLDIGYLSELDPMWDSSSLSMIIQPEAILFGNIIA
ncbi:TPA: conjugal transfer pilus assembly protein TraU, partial [Escherichia coli]|nr:conjugal transfer pilus assembly protein TraU [Escherichia coli]